MEYREFEKLGIKTSLLGFGCMRFPVRKDGSIHYQKAKQMVELAYQSGVNYFDTAYTYHNGESERFIGEVLDQYDRSTYYLATKLPCWLINSLDDAKRIFQEQLEKLHKDYVDFYLLHSLGRNTFDKMVSLGVLDYVIQLKKEGKIRYLGFSFHDGYDAFSYILHYHDWDFCQIQLNYMDIDIQAGLKGYHLTEELHIPLIIMEPVKGGSLAKLPQSATKHFKAVAPDKSVASFALRYVGSLPNVKVVLSGMSSPKQVEDNLDTFMNFSPLNDLEQEAIKKVSQVLKSRVRIGCTGCSYCMPCPAGVNIPENFSLWNEYGMYRNAGQINWAWTQGMSDKAKAKNCIECGKCETLCPQKLSIRENLKKLQAELDALVSSEANS